jgi:hypothetical protein
VSRSAVWRRSVIGERASADRCVIADGGVIGAGTHVFQRVVMPHRRPLLAHDWALARSFLRPKEQPVAVGARLGRFVFGASSSRSAALQ